MPFDADAPTPARLFEQVVALCGLSALLGPGMVRRALRDSGVARPEDAAPDDYRDALTMLHARLEAYMTPDEAAARVRRIRALLEPASRPGGAAPPNVRK
ncbi:MAG TPA: hypothetical protein VFS43_34790 [Polyangiaceae bacterium]|nr:hypothetical protein [Polyangiaceae bacterium]